MVLSMLAMVAGGFCLVSASAGEAAQKGEWSGFVERTAHRIPRLILGETTYRLQAAQGAPAAVGDALASIGAGTLKGYFVVRGTTETDATGRPWIFVDTISASTPPPDARPRPSTPASPSPADGMEQWWAERGVLHGQIRYLDYRSQVLGGTKRATVYLPPGYDETPDQRYPVLYLMNCASWVLSGKANLILDNLLAENRIAPMIAVMVVGPQAPLSSPQFAPKPTGPAAGATNPMADWIAKCGANMLQDVISGVEAKFRVRGGTSHCALAGLSIGGCQTLAAALPHLDQFGWIGPLSYSPRLELEMVAPQLAADPKQVARDVRLIFVGCGKADPLLPASSELTDWLKAKGIAHQFHQYEGAHEWRVWQRCLVDFAVQLFRERQR